MAGGKLKRKFIKGKVLKSRNHYPSTTTALINQGNILERSGHFRQAEDCFRHAIKQAPGSFQVITRLADFLRDRMRFAEAVDLYQKALGINHDNPELRHNLGVSYLFLNEFEKARNQLLQTLKLKPDHWLALCNLGKSLMQLGDPEASLIAFQQAINLKPDFAEAHFELSELFLMMGRKAEWEASCRRALEIKPNLTLAHLSLAKGIKHRGYSTDIRAMEDLLASTETNPMQKRDLSFALGKVYEDLERYDEAFAFIAKGNQLQRKTFNYDIQEDVAKFEMIRETFSSSLFKECLDKGFDGEGVIFILGMPRSGTSLVEQILASHPRVFGAGELDILDEIVRPSYKDGVFDDPQKPLAEMGRAYLNRLRALPGAAGADFISDKMPQNFIHIGMIRLILPRAKVIHCCRHPMDTCLSIYKNMFGGGHLYAYDLTELGKYYNLYLQLMRHWHKLLPGFVYDLSYEGLVHKSENEIKALLDFCGLEWNEKCLDFHNTKRLVKTISLNQVRKPIYKDSFRLWQKYGDHLKQLHLILKDDYC